MEIKVKIEDLKKHKLFVATPMYGGMAHGMYVKASLDLQAIMSKYGVETRFSFLFNESLITRARNYLVDEFLRSDCTHLLFIDSDVLPPILPTAASRLILSWVDLGNIPYSAVTQPFPEPASHLGTFESTEAVQTT